MSGQRELIETMVDFLIQSDTTDHAQLAARALGNFSFEHEENRHLLVEFGVPVRLLNLLKQSEDTTTLRNCTGALANVSFVSGRRTGAKVDSNPLLDTLQATLVEEGVISVLLKQLASPEELVVVMSLRAFGNIIDGSSFAVRLTR
jgi:hypothetical protein